MDGRELSTHRVPYGAHLLCESGHIVSRGDRIAEWDPSFSPVITEKAGTVKYQDLIENRTMTEQTDESTGITQRVVTDDLAKSKKEDLRPRLTLLGKGGKTKRASIACAGRDHRGRGRPEVEAGEVLARMPREAAGRATSPAVCRASPSCSRRASPRRMRSSPRSRARSASRRTIRPSARSRSSPTTVRSRSNIWCRSRR
jgi:hypothetical protein